MNSSGSLQRTRPDPDILMVLSLLDLSRELGDGSSSFLGLERELGEGRALDDDETTIAPPLATLVRSFRSDEEDGDEDIADEPPLYATSADFFFFPPHLGTRENRSSSPLPYGTYSISGSSDSESVKTSVGGMIVLLLDGA